MSIVGIYISSDNFLRDIIWLWPTAIAFSLLVYYARLIGEGRLPEKIRINDKGLYVWKKNKQEEQILWKNVIVVEIINR